MNRRFVLLLASILFIAVPVLPQAEAKDSLPYYIQWDSVQGAGGYAVEVRNPKGETVFTKQFQSTEQDTELELPAGAYQFRIVTLNKLLKADNATDWVAIEVLAVTAPVFVKLTPTALTTGKPVALTLTADRLTLTARAKLVSPSGKEISLAIQKIKNDTFKLTAPAIVERGQYSLVLVNSADFTTRKNNLVTATYPDFTITATSLLSSIITVKGHNFSKETTLYLSPASIPATRNKIPLAAMNDTTITASLPADLPAGDYSILLANAPDLQAKSIYAFTISPPAVAVAQPVESPAALQPPESTPQPESSPPLEPALPAGQTTAIASKEVSAPTTDTPVETKIVPVAPKTIRRQIAVGGGIKTDCIFGGWENVYPGNRFSGYGFSDFYVTNNLRPKKGVSYDFSLGLRADYSSMTNDGSGKYVKSDAQNFSGLICPAFTVSIPLIRAKLYLAAGCEYISVSAKNMYGTETIRAAYVDPAGGLGLSIDFPITDYFALGIANQLLYVHDSKSILKYTVSAFLAVMIPVKY